MDVMYYLNYFCGSKACPNTILCYHFDFKCKLLNKKWENHGKNPDHDQFHINTIFVRVVIICF